MMQKTDLRKFQIIFFSCFNETLIIGAAETILMKENKVEEFFMSH
jgi:hypothetical protein